MTYTKKIRFTKAKRNESQPDVVLPGFEPGRQAQLRAVTNVCFA
jgi:hypothetical protein